MPNEMKNVTPIKQFSPQNWEYILRSVADQVRKTGPETQRIFQQLFDERIEARLNDIAPVHQAQALTIARKYDFMTAKERKDQFLEIPKWRYASN